MATISAKTGAFGGGNLSNAQTGNGASTNILDRGSDRSVALVKITTAVGATPTCTYTIEGSPDGTNWFPAAYADSATPATVAAANFTLTTATTVYKILTVDQPWRFLRLNYSANTNVTNTVDVFSPAT